MKKYLFILFLTCGCFTNAYPQWQNLSAHGISLSKYDVLDTACLKCTYKFTHLFDTLDASSVRSDIHTLLVGEKMSKYYSQNYVDYCTLKEMKQTTDVGPFKGTCGLEVFKGYPEKGKTTVTDLGGETWFGANLMYEEDIPKITWTIQSDTTSVLFYKCRKATCEFRGRKYDAWFTTAIPVPNGPWKLGGLPGLILKAEDDKREVTFECIGIERPVNMEVTRLVTGTGKLEEVTDRIRTEPIKLYTVKYKKVSRDEAERNVHELCDDMATYLKKHEIYLGGLGETPPIPHNPIEKVYHQKEKSLKRVSPVAPLITYDPDTFDADRLIAEIVKDNAGKVILVDFWATWCGPCLRAIDDMRTFELPVKKEELARVYVTNSTSPWALWESKSKEIGGQHYYLSGAVWKTVTKKYAFGAIPSYLIFNKRGELRYQFTDYPGNTRMGEMIKDCMDE